MWLKESKGRALVCDLTILSQIGTILIEMLIQLRQNCTVRLATSRRKKVKIYNCKKRKK